MSNSPLHPSLLVQQNPPLQAAEPWIILVLALEPEHFHLVLVPELVGLRAELLPMAVLPVWALQGSLTLP